MIARVGRPKDLAAAKDIASVIAKRASRYVLQELQTLQPENLASIIVKRWQDRGCSPITSCAPYAAHVLLVDLLFCLAMGADLIGRERPSNKVDFAYLYYLPFCMVFTSRDKLHARTAPLFLADNQVFVHGDDLKADLARLNKHYLKLPPEVKLRGVMSFAHYPPVEGDFLISRLWDQLMAPGWRDVAVQPPPIQSAEDTSKIISEINEIADAPRRTRVPPIPVQEAGAVIMRRRVPLHRGNWRMLPPEIEESRS